MPVFPLVFLFLLAAVLAAGEQAAAQNVPARPGVLDGSWLWVMPNTPGGLRPTQSWHATGSTPTGTIYPCMGLFGVKA